MNYHILYNPLAGNGDAENKIRAILSSYEGDMIFTDITELNDYAEFFSSLGDDETVIIAGGDGTLNRFINSTVNIEIKCDVLYCAGGSGNDFLHDVGTPDNDKPLKINDYIKDLPVVEVNGKEYRFLNNVGFGIDGYCCEVGDEMKKTSDKPVNYTAIAIKGLLFHYKPCGATVTVDGKEYRYEKVWLAPTMQGSFDGGGMMPTPEQDRNDPSGELSLLLFHGSGKLKTLRVFPSIFKGEHVKHEKIVTIHKGSDISVTFDKPTALQIDGETILGVTSYHAKAKAAVAAEAML